MVGIRANRKVILALTACLAILISTHAECADAVGDAQTRDLLIDKLAQVYTNLPANDPSKTAVALRMADLLSERARLAAMQEMNAGCVVCEAGRDDRKRALSYYQEVIQKVPAENAGKVMTQIGHLQELTGNEKEAIATYQRMLSEYQDPAVIAEAHLSLGEIYFKRGQFREAKPHFSAILSQTKVGSRGLAAFRLAWSDFNSNQVDSAIQGLKAILASPELLARTSTSNAAIDKQFQEEVSRDLATFLSRRAVTLADAESLYELSPESTRLNNVAYLAGELERLGQIKPSIEIWRYTMARQTRPLARFEGHVRLAQMQMQMRERPEAIRDFEAALTLWPQVSVGCEQNADCKELKNRIRKFVVDWNRSEKKTPPVELLSAYQSYLKVFPNEIDMRLWAAQVARDLKEWSAAIDLYISSAKSLDGELKNVAPTRLVVKSVEGKDKSAKDEFAKDRSIETVGDKTQNLEATLLAAIEVAELSKDPRFLDSAYDTYLALTRAKKQVVEVRYQKANLIYDKGDHGIAAQAMYDVALASEPGSRDVKIKAADLALDALVLLKDDARMEKWALEFAKLFPERADEYNAIARKSVLTQTTQLAESSSTLDQAWATLGRFDLLTATPADKITFYKNRLILAEKLQKFSEARDSAENLLRFQGLSEADRQFALSRKAWLAELMLDFETALITTEKMTLAELSPEQKWLKLALFADLSNKDSKSYYSNYLKETRDQEKALVVAARFVRESAEPVRELEKQKSVLSKNPVLLAQLQIEIFAKTKSLDFARKALASPGVKSTVPGQIMARQLFLADFSKFKPTLAQHKIDSSSQRKMASSLKARVALIEKAEKWAAQAVETADWTSQLVTLDLVARESRRFYDEILSLPVPAGLDADEESQYLNLLAQQAAPHQTRAKDVEVKVQEFWANEKAIELLETSVVKAGSAELRELAAQEVEMLKELAPENRKAQLIAALSTQREIASGAARPSLQSLEVARQEVRENPMSLERLKKLMELENLAGRNAMVGYLETRIQELQNPATNEGMKK